MSKSKSNIQYLFVFIVVFAIAGTISLISHDNEKKITPNNNDNMLVVHFLDVGQGDCEFIELPNSQCMLIDASTKEYGDDIVEAIKGYGYSEIDYVVATHPHADHIGGMSEVIDSFDIGKIYMPRTSSNSKSFEGLLTSISNKNLSINTAKTGTTIYSDNGINIEILSPISSFYEETNDYSAVVKLEYGESSFLFMGDAEKPVENELIEKYGYDLDVDVLKAGHHGSRYSSSTEFLDYVTPEYTVISCAKENSYGHPHSETIKRLNNVNTQIFRTYELGNITVSCDSNDSFEISYDWGI